MQIHAPKGTKDLLPKESYKWHYIEDKLIKLAKVYGLKEIRTPAFENTELFLRGVGETTDVVQKEMYTFNDKGGRSITLKPEGTASAVRAFVENGLFNDAQPTKLYYFTQAFRYENTQKGRLREHHQFGIEIFGSKEPSVDAEIISAAMKLYSEIGVTSVKLNINSIGCPICRKEYNEILKAFLKENYDNLCDTCKSRYEKNPMRILDCKEIECKKIVKNAPVMLDHLCPECREHFESLKNYLKVMDVEYTINPYIVRGLDYYTKTVFEIIDKDITICGGGRYDGLIEECGGPAMPAVGFGMGLERLLMTLEEHGIIIPEPKGLELYIASMTEECKFYSVKLASKMRDLGIKCEIDHMNRSLKAQMKYSNKIAAEYVVVIGEEEMSNKKAKLKRMSDGNTFDIDLEKLENIINIIKNN